MESIPLSECQGLDTRPSLKDDDFSLITGDNLQVLPGGSLTLRPALVRFADVHEQSVGLYSRGGYLRCVVPSGLSLQELAPTGFIYDGIGRGGSFDYSDKIDQVLAVETFGTSPVSGPHGYLAIKRSDSDVIEHHWVKQPPSSFASFTDTYIRLPFQPGRSLSKVGEKILAPDPANGYLRYCSTLNGPSDWTAVGDAGFEAVLQYVSGSREIIALGVHRGLAAVFFADAVQLWFLDADPANNQLRQVLYGPGTEFPGSVVNIYGDAHFLGRGGFSNLENAKITGEALYADIGDRIKTLSASIQSTDTPIGVWSQKRAQWLLAVGTTIYCYANYPRAGTTSWMRWVLPVSVDAIAENEGTVYVRSGDVVYRLDDTIGRDDGQSSDIAWTWQTRGLRGPKSVRAKRKAIKSATVECTTAATYTPVADERVLTGASCRVPGDTGARRLPLGGSGRRVGLRAEGTGLVTITGAELLVEECGV